MSAAEQSEKHARIRDLLERKNLDALVLRKGANVAWLIGGRAHIPTTLELSCLDLVVYPDRIVAVTNKIEAQRLIDEELTGNEELIVINWFEGRDAQLPKGARIGTDGPDPDRVNILSDVESLRRRLNSHEIARFREIGIDATAALEAAMLDIESDQSEVEVAAEIAEELWERNLEPVVLLVAGEERIEKYRHPLPTKSRIGKNAMGVICARRKGLIVSITRLVHFGEIPELMQEKYRRLLQVEAAFLSESRSGSKFSDAFKAGSAAYLKYGFERDEWTRHHQGGPTGYLPRDFTANENTHQEIEAGMAIAWNPSISGLKAEDTILITGPATGLRTGQEFEFISGGPGWPTIEIEGRSRPAIAPR